jgi:hypothetical protein
MEVMMAIMNKSRLVEKYNNLASEADKHLDAARHELKTALDARNLNSPGWKELAEYQEADDNYLRRKQVSQIYNNFCVDLESAMIE